MVATLICLGIGLLLFVGEMFTPGLGAMGVLGPSRCSRRSCCRSATRGHTVHGRARTLPRGRGAPGIFPAGHEGKFDKSRIILNERIDGSSNSLKETDFQSYVGSTGVALTALRPAARRNSTAKCWMS
jgi:hypothetical protein